jgi:hypothetical protein
MPPKTPIKASELSGRAIPASKLPAPKRKSLKNAWIWPVSSARITSVFEPGHRAVDIGVPVGTPLYAPRAGVIAKVAYDAGGYGEHIVLNTIDGLLIYLGHLSEVNVSPGQNVTPGQQIGRTGNTGSSTGPHLHYEIRQGSGRIDPLSLGYSQANKPAGVVSSTPQATSLHKASSSVKPMAYTSDAPPPEPAQAPVINITKEGVQITPENLVISASGTTLKEFWEKINWGNIVAGGIGIILIAVGIFGIMSSEIVKIAVQQVTEKAQPIIEAVKAVKGAVE